LETHPSTSFSLSVPSAFPRRIQCKIKKNTQHKSPISRASGLFHLASLKSKHLSTPLLFFVPTSLIFLCRSPTSELSSPQKWLMMSSHDESERATPWGLGPLILIFHCLGFSLEDGCAHGLALDGGCDDSRFYKHDSDVDCARDDAEVEDGTGKIKNRCSSW